MTQPHDILKRLDTYTGRQMTIDELVKAADELLQQLAPKQTRYKVSERPDVRTIRYYTSQGLLPPPTGYQGGRARYAIQHLTRLLLIKKLQAEHHTLQKIKRVLSAADDQLISRELFGSIPEPSPRPPESKDSLAAVEPATTSERTTTRRPQETIKRFVLAHGSTLDIPQSVFADPGRLSMLAEDLVAIARQLGDGVKDGQEGRLS